MKNKIIAVIAGLLLFAAAFIIVLVLNARKDTAKDSYVDKGQTDLTELYFNCADMRTNPLFGFAEKSDSIESNNTLLPVDDETVEICFQDASNIDSVSVFLESEDRTRLLDETNVTMYKKGGISRCDYQLSVMAEMGEEYYLTVCANTKDGKVGYYTTKIAVLEEGNIQKKQKMLEFAADFSNSVLEKKTENISSYVKVDDSKAGKDLSYVNLSTPLNLITWAGLEPKQGEKSLVIYEWNSSQISIAFCYDVTSKYEDETNEYHVKECFTVRQRDDKLFLLDYRRFTSQKYDGRSDQIGNTSILLGIQDKNTLDAEYGNGKKDIFFIADGKIWHFNTETNMLISIYGGEYKTSYEREYPYELSIVNLVDNKLYFSALGYVPYGTREGQNGFALYEYDAETGVLKEEVYIKLNGSLDMLKLTSAVVEYLSDDRLFTVEVNGNLYSMDLTGSDVISLAKDMDLSHTFINGTGNMAAWQTEEDRDRIYLMDLDSGDIRNISSDKEDIELLGFVKDDLVYGIKSGEKWEFQGFTMYELYDGIKIVNSDLEQKVDYNNKKGKLCNIGINSSNVTMTLCGKTDGKWGALGTDTLNLASDDGDDKVSPLMTASSEIKRNYYYLALPSALDRSKGYVRKEATYAKTEEITLKPGSAQLSYRYTAWEYGQMVVNTDDVSKAIDKVFDTFGSVQGNKGEDIWDRDARELYLTMNLPKMKWTEEGYEDVMASMSILERAVDIFVYAGVMTGSISQDEALDEGRKAAVTVCEELELVFGDKLIVLGNTDISKLLYYINLRHPVLALASDGTALLLTGYTSTKLTYYNPADRSSTSITMEEAEEMLDGLEAYYVCYR